MFAPVGSCARLFESRLVYGSSGGSDAVRHACEWQRQGDDGFPVVDRLCLSRTDHRVHRDLRLRCMVWTDDRRPTGELIIDVDSAPDLSRRGLLRGRTRHTQAFRPPWALAEPLFVDACTRCRACVERCPEQVLVIGDGGFPEFDAKRGECTFCGDCAGVCESKALDPGNLARPWLLQATVSDMACLAHSGVVCASCQDPCPEQAIRMQPVRGAVAIPQIDAARCIGCGACVSACPTSAITMRHGVAMEESA